MANCDTASSAAVSLPWTKRNPLESNKDLLIVNNERDWNRMSPKLMKSLETFKVLGFDAEWVSAERYKALCANRSTSFDFYDGNETLRSCAASGRIALIQMATVEGVCMLVRLCLFEIDEVPHGLTNLLQNQAIVKAGVAIMGDKEKLLKDWRISLNGCLDLRHVMMAFPEVELKNYGDQQFARRKYGLKAICGTIFGISAPEEDKLIQRSDWCKAKLSSEQIYYAARDAQSGADIVGMLTATCLQPGGLPPSTQLGDAEFQRLNNYLADKKVLNVAYDSQLRRGFVSKETAKQPLPVDDHYSDEDDNNEWRAFVSRSAPLYYDIPKHLPMYEDIIDPRWFEDFDEYDSPDDPEMICHRDNVVATIDVEKVKEMIKNGKKSLIVGSEDDAVFLELKFEDSGEQFMEEVEEEDDDDDDEDDDDDWVDDDEEEADTSTGKNEQQPLKQCQACGILSADVHSMYLVPPQIHCSYDKPLSILRCSCDEIDACLICRIVVENVQMAAIKELSERYDIKGTFGPLCFDKDEESQELKRCAKILLTHKSLEEGGSACVNFDEEVSVTELWRAETTINTHLNSPFGSAISTDYLTTLLSLGDYKAVEQAYEKPFETRLLQAMVNRIGSGVAAAKEVELCFRQRYLEIAQPTVLSKSLQAGANHDIDKCAEMLHKRLRGDCSKDSLSDADSNYHTLNDSKLPVFPSDDMQALYDDMFDESVSQRLANQFVDPWFEMEPEEYLPKIDAWKKEHERGQLQARPLARSHMLNSCCSAESGDSGSAFRSPASNGSAVAPKHPPVVINNMSSDDDTSSMVDGRSMLSMVSVPMSKSVDAVEESKINEACGSAAKLYHNLINDGGTTSSSSQRVRKHNIGQSATGQRLLQRGGHRSNLSRDSIDSPRVALFKRAVQGIQKEAQTTNTVVSQNVVTTTLIRREAKPSVESNTSSLGAATSSNPITVDDASIVEAGIVIGEKSRGRGGSSSGVGLLNFEEKQNNVVRHRLMSVREPEVVDLRPKEPRGRAKKSQLLYNFDVHDNYYND